MRKKSIFYIISSLMIGLAPLIAIPNNTIYKSNGDIKRTTPYSNYTELSQEVESNGIAASGQLSKYSPKELIGLSETSGSNKYTTLKQFVASNITSILSNYSNSPVLTIQTQGFYISKIESVFDSDSSVYIEAYIPNCSTRWGNQTVMFGFIITNLSTILETTFNLNEEINATAGLTTLLPQNLYNNPNNTNLKELLSNSIVENPPQGFDASNITDVTISSFNNKEGLILIQDITINLYVNENKEISTIPKTVAINTTIKNLVSVSSTQVKSSEISSSIVGVDLEKAKIDIQESAKLETLSKEWILNNYNKIFNFLPENFQGNNITNIQLERNKINPKNNSATFIIEINNFYEDNSTCTQVTSRTKQFEVILSNILLTAPNNESTTNIGLWIGIGVGSFVLVVIIVLLIIFLIRKKNKEKNKKYQPIKKPINNMLESKSQSASMQQNIKLGTLNNSNQINSQQRPGQPVRPGQMNTVQGVPQIPGQPVRPGQMNTVQGAPQIPGQPVRPGQPIRPGQAPQPQRPTPPPPITMDRGPKSMAPKIKNN